MSDASKAVFLSYAREDAAAARRIAEALRTQGIEVWFDENELRGGDAWDAKIRRQIDACSLFVPIISSHTQERSKGYFRLEWKLAVDQTHLLAAGIPFVAPVVIDTTKESEAVVPPEFMRVQWTRLPDALPTPQFVEQMKRLLNQEQAAASKEQGGRKTDDRRQRTEDGGRSSESGVAPRKSWLVPAIVGMAVAAGLAFFMLRKPAPTSAEATVGKPVAATESKPAAMSTDKSIAVIPFTNMSEDKEGNAFFADGIHEDILTNLALIRELRVVSRTSVLSYRNTTKSMKQIAQELGVTYILEGSVRRVGNKVRVTGQLIHAATDEHVWAQAYDRDLTDIFAIQSELSSQIAGALKAALSPQEKILIARRPTDNPAAYDLFLRARETRNIGGNNPATLSKAITLLKSAVELDPAFAQAWGELATGYAYWCFLTYDDADVQLARAKAAIERAMSLAPEDPEIFSSLGTYYYYGYRDYARAAEQYERRARLQPNSPVVFNSLALIQRRQGRWAESLVNARRACELDPSNRAYHFNLLATLRAGRRWDEALAIRRRISALRPDDLQDAYNVAYGQFEATGSTREGEAFFAQLTEAKRNSPLGLELQKIWAGAIGNFAEAVRLDRLQPYYDEDGTPRYEQAYFVAINYYAMGDREGARKRLENFPAELRARLELEPKSVRLLAFLAGMEQLLDRKEESLRYIERCAELMPLSRDALDGAMFAAYRAIVYDWTGEKEKALAAYARALSTPTTTFSNIHELRAGYSTLRGDPRYEALLNDPKNNAPLF